MFPLIGQLQIMHLSDFKTRSAPLFVSSGILPIKMLYMYFKTVASWLHGIDNHCALPNISELCIRSEQIHLHFLRFSAGGNFCVKKSRINQQLWNGIPKELQELRKALCKRELGKLLLQILEMLICAILKSLSISCSLIGIPPVFFPFSNLDYYC